MPFLGLISDTHGQLPLAAVTLLQGAEAILHAGDVGDDVLPSLREIAPVIAIAGNVDPPRLQLPFAARHRWDRFDIVVTHNLAAEGDRLPPVEEGRIGIVVCGHSHRPEAWDLDDRIAVNPGAAGPRRFDLPRTAARLCALEERWRVEWYDIEHRVVLIDAFERRYG